MKGKKEDHVIIRSPSICKTAYCPEVPIGGTSSESLYCARCAASIQKFRALRLKQFSSPKRARKL